MHPLFVGDNAGPPVHEPSAAHVPTDRCALAASWDPPCRPPSLVSELWGGTSRKGHRGPVRYLRFGHSEMMQLVREGLDSRSCTIKSDHSGCHSSKEV